ncbi:UbiD family decarboxylase [Paratractidigestivibacter sp.]|uniref:UbiD family decarboxylase n=1 Tax=Paratractidigestivibacter sp. TaxID=2847316 RepID=UPI002ABD2AD5|nr:UbiD family decarboxylase [Paratractidigestivibacter sp.]
MTTTATATATTAAAGATTTVTADQIHDLRSALDFLRGQPGQLLETDVEVDPDAEVSGVYRHVGAGGTLMRPTKEGPAMLFSNVKGYDDASVAIGLLSSRRRTAALLGLDEQRLGVQIAERLHSPVAPAQIAAGKHIDCQEVVYRATDHGFDLRRIVPAPTNTPVDGGPYITMGLAYGTSPDGAMSDVTIHRFCCVGPDRLTMFITPGSRHLGAFFDLYRQRGEDMPISISIGLDPAVYMCCGFEAPTTPLGFNELQIAGALRGRPVELADCLSVSQKCIANAEFVIEGYLCHDEEMNEDVRGRGFAMPEFPGYTGDAKVCPVIRVTAVTTRARPIMQSCIGPSHEHVSMAGIPTEASIYQMVERAIPGRLVNVHAAPCGGGKFVAILQVRKPAPSDEGRQRNAALLAFSAFSELKHVFLVDEDVDIFDMSDVMWAMTTRFQADVDLIAIPGCHCHVLDPSNDPAFSPSIREHGVACKAIFDCTVPYAQRDGFVRSRFMDIDKEKWASVLG